MVRLRTVEDVAEFVKTCVPSYLEKFIPPQVVQQGIDGHTLSNCRTITEVQSVFAGINTASVGIFTSRPC